MGWRDVLAVAGFVFGSGAFVTVLRMWLGHRDAHHDIARRLDEGQQEFATVKASVVCVEKRSHSLVAGVREIMVSLGLRQPGQSINGEED